MAAARRRRVRVPRTAARRPRGGRRRRGRGARGRASQAAHWGGCGALGMLSDMRAAALRDSGPAASRARPWWPPRAGAPPRTAALRRLQVLVAPAKRCDVVAGKKGTRGCGWALARGTQNDLLLLFDSEPSCV